MSGLDIELPVLLTTQEIFESVQLLRKEDDRKRQLALRVRHDLDLLFQYTNLLIKDNSPKKGKIEASLMVATINHLTTDGKELARRIRALCNHFARYKGIPLETRGGKRTGLLLLDNKEVFLACRAWLVIQEVGTVTPEGFRNAINQEILPSCLIVPKMPVARDSYISMAEKTRLHKEGRKEGCLY